MPTQSDDLERCYAILELPSGAKPGDVERNWQALCEIYNLDRFLTGSKAYSICAAKLRAVNQAYKKIQSALGQQGRAEEQHSIIDLIKKAESGDNEAAYKLACLLEEGVKYKEDLRNAAFWFGLAAKRGHLESQYKLGDAFLNGRGVERDYTKALQCFLRTAANGHRESCFALGLLYENGLGVARNFKEALSWFEKAASKGDKEAANKIYFLKQQAPQEK